MKHTFYICIAFCALLFAGCADKDIVDNTDGNKELPGVKVSMTLEGDMQGDNVAPAGAKSTRAIGYETRPSDGFPTPIGVFDKGLNDGKELNDGDKVDVLLIFRSTDDTQPITKVKTQWTYTKGGKLALMPSETFEMAAGTNLNQGTWYVCGILGGEMLVGNNQVKFNGYMEGHNAIDQSGNKVTWGANIPYVFSWRKLIAKSNNTFKADKPVIFKQFGSIVRLKVTNKTGFNFKYNGVRLITSNILCGQFDLKAFEDKDLVPTSTLHDTQDNEIASAKSSTFQDAFKPFKFYQRPLTDQAMTGGSDPNKGLITMKRFRIKGDYYENWAEEKANNAKADNDLTKKFNTALYYFDHTFLEKSTGNNFDDVPNGSDAPSYIYVWVAPQEQVVKIYNGNVEDPTSTAYTVKSVAKTQFLLMAVPTETSSGTRVVPKSINMIPAYGSLKSYVSGANYPAYGTVVYNFPPLSYIAKHDNFGTDAELSNEGNQDVAHTKRYTYNQTYEGQEKVVDHLSSIPADYMFAKNEYWRSIIPQYYGFAGFRNSGTTYKDYCMGIVTPARLPGWSGPKLVFHSYSKGVPGSNISYMLGMSQKPDYIQIDNSVKGEGQSFQGYAKQAGARINSGITPIPDWIQNNNFRFTIRYEDKDGTAILTQRYLGPRFVLDMDDIANEDFWAMPNNYGVTYPEDAKRVFPYAGVNSSAEANGQTIWFFDQNTKGKMTQYWTPDNTAVDGRYNPKGPNRKGAMLGNGEVLPKQAVVFVGANGGSETSGFYQHYLFINVPTNGERTNADPRYKRNFITSAPVRLWRTKAYAD
ncbi:hypothetical protein [Segatella salivae]|uniref:hypothetical protein n=1 Tax=Segatella salivae TaxID=228604 RepID=UPI001CAFE6A6|nr:hypothetical protein [Segatella salivae]MBF1560132.1 hypothetical protein [Segatella salivae]